MKCDACGAEVRRNGVPLAVIMTLGAIAAFAAGMLYVEHDLLNYFDSTKNELVPANGEGLLSRFRHAPLSFKVFFLVLVSTFTSLSATGCAAAIFHERRRIGLALLFFALFVGFVFLGFWSVSRGI